MKNSPSYFLKFLVMKKIFSLFFFAFGAVFPIFAQFQQGLVEKIDLQQKSTTEDRIIIQGKGLPNNDLIQLRRLKYPILNDLQSFQWEIRIENADLAPNLKNAMGSLRKNSLSIIESVSVESKPTTANTLKTNVVFIYVKIQPQEYSDNPSLHSAAIDVRENDLTEVSFQKNRQDLDYSLLTRVTKKENSELDQNELPVPVLRVSIVGYDGAKNLIDSKATKLSVYLSADRREELNKKFGIQFFINNVSLNREKILKQTVIYYRFEANDPKKRFLKEALYLANLIPNESMVRPMVNADKKTGVDLEIFVGKDLQ